MGTKCLCSKCQNTFLKEDKTQYIEIHHIIPLHKGGMDVIWNLSPLCAFHHSMAHFANVKERIRMEKELLKEVGRRL